MLFFSIALMSKYYKRWLLLLYMSVGIYRVKIIVWLWLDDD